MSGVRASRLQASSIFMLADHGYLEFRFTFLRVIVIRDDYDCRRSRLCEHADFPTIN